MCCVRCGFQSRPETKHELGNSSDADIASKGNAVTPQPSWKQIWAQQVEKRRSRRWRIFLIVYLALIAAFAIKVPVGDLGFVALFGFVYTLLITYALNFIWSSWIAVVTYKKSMSHGLFEATTRSIFQLNWTRLFAVVLTSNFFFFASCAGGMVLGVVLLDHEESGTNIALGRELDARMSIIAVIPNPEKPTEGKIVQTPLANLERFKKDNPGYSFVVPPGKGEVSIPELLLGRVEYTVTSAERGKVIVVSKFHDDERHVLAKYSATEREVEPLYTKSTHDLATFMSAIFFGFPFAIALALIGYFLKWLSRRST